MNKKVVYIVCNKYNHPIKVASTLKKAREFLRAQRRMYEFQIIKIEVDGEEWGQQVD